MVKLIKPSTVSDSLHLFIYKKSHGICIWLVPYSQEAALNLGFCFAFCNQLFPSVCLFKDEPCSVICQPYIYPLICGQTLGRLHLLAVVDNAATKMGVPVPL